MSKEEWSDRDLESLFAGREPTEGDLACLAPIVEAIRREAENPVRPEAGAIVPALAEAAKGSAVGAPVGHRGSKPWRRRLVTIGGVAALATVGVGSAAVASDGAAPGDLLYSVDQAFEAIGIGDGGIQERLDEATKLTENGQPDQALEHAANAYRKEGNDEAARALVQAAVSVQNQGAERSAEVRAQVSEMLQWMESTDAEGRNFGQGVSERARGVEEAASRGKSADAPGHNKDDSAGDSGDDSPGNSGRGRGTD
jgi:hypothetical protein